MQTVVASPQPHFIGIGLQKSGTRWLYNQLQKHPDFWMPPIKELHFFDKGFPHGSTLDKLSKRSTNRSGKDQEFLQMLRTLERSKEPDFEVYASLFTFGGDRLTGDITPAYSRLEAPEVQLIADKLPWVKVILLLRDPISRAWSNINDAAAKGKLSEAVLSEAAQLKPVLGMEFFSGLSYPSRIYQRWAKHFPRDQLRYFFLDDIIANPEETRAAILRYLGGDPAKKSGDLALSHNSKSGRPRAPLEGEVRSLLIEEFQEELRSCAEIFGGPATGWLAKYGLN